MKFTAAAAFALVLIAASATAQWVRYPESGVPRRRDGSVNLSAPTPKLGGKVDLSGVWLAEPNSREQLGPFAPPEEFLGEPGFSRYFFNFFFDFPRGQEPYTAAGAAAVAAAQATPRSTSAQESACNLPGLPQWNLIPAPFKIVHGGRQTVILYEAGTVFRQIYTDGRPLPADPNPSRFGYSTGRWDGNSLLVTTVGVVAGMIDAVGHPQSERLRLIERFRRIDYGHMVMETTLDDPGMYTRPVTITVPFILLPDTDVLEAFCQENEKDLIHLRNAATPAAN